MHHEGREWGDGSADGGGCGWVPGTPEADGSGGWSRGVAQLQSLSTLLPAGGPERHWLQGRGRMSRPQVGHPWVTPRSSMFRIFMPLIQNVSYILNSDV